MTTLLTIGTLVGLVIGMIHAWYVYRQRICQSPVETTQHPLVVRAKAVYFALWTIALWTLFGSYVFYLWVLSVVIYAGYKGIKRITAPGLNKAAKVILVEAK